MKRNHLIKRTFWKSHFGVKAIRWTVEKSIQLLNKALQGPTTQIRSRSSLRPCWTKLLWRNGLHKCVGTTEKRSHPPFSACWVRHPGVEFYIFHTEFPLFVTEGNLWKSRHWKMSIFFIEIKTRAIIKSIKHKRKRCRLCITEEETRKSEL